MEIIHGYTLISPLETTNAGTASWTSAVKGGRKFFLKRFDDPKYTESAKLACIEYENRKTKLYNALSHADNGNIIFVSDFFREETFYYSTTEYVESSVNAVDEIRRMDPNKKLVVMKALAHSFMRLAENGIIHSDLKPTNIILKYTFDGYATVKLIDFDSGYLESNPPMFYSDEIEGDQRYLSPEALRALCGDDVHITPKADIFAMGVLFHEFFTGNPPEIPGDEYDYLSEAVLNGLLPVLDTSIPEEYRNLIEKMLIADPDERLSAQEVFTALRMISDPEEEFSEDEILEPDDFFEDDVPPKKIVQDDGSDLFKKLGDL